MILQQCVTNFAKCKLDLSKIDMIPKEWAVVPFTYFQMITLCTNSYIVPQLLVSKVCHKAFNNTVCSQLGKPKFKSQENYVFGKAAEWNALVNFAGFFPATILILPLGSMVDFVSKRNILLLPAIASLLSSLINLVSSVYITLHEGFLVLASFVISIFGDVPGSIMFCCAYSVSARSGDRLLAVAVVIASVQCGLATGSLIANYLTRYYGFSSAFLFTTIALVIGLLDALILIPPIDEDEKKIPEKECSDRWGAFKEHTKETWLHLVSFAKKHFLDAKDKTILLLLVAGFFNFASYGGERALITLFLKHSPLNLKANEIGIYLTLFEFSRALGPIILAVVINRYIQLSDYTVMFIGTISKILKYTVLSFSRTKLMAYASTILACPSILMASAVRSQLTKLASKEDQGVSISFVALLASSSVLVMSLGANGLFVATAKIYSGFSILLISCSNLIALIVLCYIVYIKKHKGATTSGYSGLSTKDDEDNFNQNGTN